MRVIPEFGAIHSLYPVRCILIYESKHGAAGNSQDKARVATIHNIQLVRRSPVIMPGLALTAEGIHSIVMGLAGATSDKANFLPENVLCCTPSKMIWWKPAHISQMFFDITDKEKLPNEAELNGCFFSHPALIFMRTIHHLHVFTMEGNTRPTLDTELFLAPYLNLDEEARLCFGNAKRPTALLPSAIKEYESAFFDTKFSHTNRGGVVHHPDGHFGFWKNLVVESEGPMKPQPSMGHFCRYGGKRLEDIL